MTAEVLVIDLRGTHTKVTRARRGEASFTVQSLPTPRRGKHPGALSESRWLVREEVARRSPIAISVVVPGNLDERQGLVHEACNLGWYDVPLGSMLADDTGLPVAVGHDVRAGAVAEARVGAGRSYLRFAFLTIGKGMGAASVAGRRPSVGAHGWAGEVGHLVVRPGVTQCAYGRSGCVESLASAASISRRYALFAGGTAISAPEVIARTRVGEEPARLVWREAIDALAEAVVALQAVVDPEAAGGALLGRFRNTCATRQVAPRLELRCGQLGEAASCRRAALLAWHLHQR